MKDILKKDKVLILMTILSLVGVGAISIVFGGNEPEPVPYVEAPSYVFEVIATVKNKVTGETEKLDYFSTLALKKEGVPVSPQDDWTYYREMIGEGIQSYIVHEKISETSPWQDWDHSVDGVVQIDVGTGQLEGLKQAVKWRDEKKLCWESYSGDIMTDDTVTTPNFETGFSETGGTIGDKVNFYEPVECK